MAHISRRNILRGSAALGFTSATGLLSTMNAAQAATTSGYKALVCVFLKGGFDGTDMIVPRDAASHAALASAREDLFARYDADSPDSSRNRDNLLRLPTERNFGGRQFGMPSELKPFHDLYKAGKLAVMGNVGPLVMPTTRDQMAKRSVELPARLFSHNDQQATWMSMGLEGRRFGWGGQFADRVAPAAGAARTFASITAAAPDIWLRGARTRQYPGSKNGPVRLRYAEDVYPIGQGRDEARRILAEHYASKGRTSDNVFMRDLIAGNQRTQANNALFRDAIAKATAFATPFPSSKIGKQLATIAATISVRASFSASRQVFYASVGGFDTHAAQDQNMPKRMGDVANAVKAFNDAMEEIGLGEMVTLFTASDFGRTIIGNGDGTDHGWGNHHIVAGGAVKGGEIYGDIPPMDFGLAQYTETRGRMIPTTSVDQYAASLGKWFGLDGAELRDALPNLGNFASIPDLFGQGATV